MAWRSKLNLLGRPTIVHGGSETTGLRGNKAWGVLAYLVFAHAQTPREELAELLFADAADPLGALRWNLSVVRRALGEDVLQGQALLLRFPPGTKIDVHIVTSGRWEDALQLGGFGRPLLESMTFYGGFDAWLEVERARMAGTTRALLREACLAQLGMGDPREAASVAARLTRLDPYEEEHWLLLVRSLGAAGDHAAARRQAATASEMFRRDLDVDVSGTLASAAVPRKGFLSLREPSAASADAHLEAGQAAIQAGAVGTGLESLRRAVADARTIHGEGLLARALLELGTALIHAARGHDDEGASVLYEVLDVGEKDSSTIAAACRELGYTEFLGARYDRSLAWLERALAVAADDSGELGRIRSVLGSVLSDLARYPEALTTLEQSIRDSEVAGDRRGVAYTRSMIGRVHLLRGHLNAAERELNLSEEGARTESWTGFLPWPQALLGHVQLHAGHVGAARDRFEHAFALGCQLGDPCWEALAARGLALAHVSEGDIDEAVHTFLDALRRCRRVRDTYRWVDCYIGLALAEVGVNHGLADAAEWVDDVERMAAGAGIREFVVLAKLLRFQDGDRGALDDARSLSIGIDNPNLMARISGASREPING